MSTKYSVKVRILSAFQTSKVVHVKRGTNCWRCLPAFSYQCLRRAILYTEAKLPHMSGTVDFLDKFDPDGGRDFHASLRVTMTTRS